MANSLPPVGFIGLGVMGQPMALNLARAGTPLVVWNRTAAAAEPLAAAGGAVVPVPAAVFERCRVIIVMLVDETAIDAVLERGRAAFAPMLHGRTLVNMGSVPPDYSRALGADIRAAGGRYVECPVSGSRKPAEAGRLVAMIAGDDADVAGVRPLLAPMCHEVVACGAVPNALTMKLSVNLFMLTTMAGLAEAFHFATAHRLDPQQFLAAIEAGPMASGMTRVKGPKLAAGDFSVHATAADGYRSNQLISEAARAAAIATPLLDVTHALYGEVVALGHGQQDMSVVLRAIEARTATRTS